MRSANHSAPLQGLRLYKALLGLIQASGLAGGFDFGVAEPLLELLQCIPNASFSKYSFSPEVDSTAQMPVAARRARFDAITSSGGFEHENRRTKPLHRLDGRYGLAEVQEHYAGWTFFMNSR